MYALISPDNQVVKYPLSINQWRVEHPSVSLPERPTKQQLEEFGIVKVEFSNPPNQQYIFNYEETVELNDNGLWQRAWIITDASEEEIYSRTTEQSVKTRQLRNEKLAECDWTQLTDAPVNKAAWATYRQKLRDLTAQEGFPWEVQWPEAP